MGNSVRFILASTLFMLCLGINESAARTKTCSQDYHQFNPHTNSVLFKQAQSSINLQGSRVFSLSDVERTRNSNTTSSEYNQFRIRRIHEITTEIKDIVLQLSLLESSFALDLSKTFHSDRYPKYAKMTCDYYIFALRRILI